MQASVRLGFQIAPASITDEYRIEYLIEYHACLKEPVMTEVAVTTASVYVEVTVPTITPHVTRSTGR